MQYALSITVLGVCSRRLISVSESFGGLPNNKLSSGMSQWWRERVQHLIDCGRAEDARCFSIEFGKIV